MGYNEKLNLLCLKAKINGLAAESLRTRIFIRKTTHERRARHWDVKRDIGRITRHHLLAYGLLRGSAYATLENPGKGNGPDASLIHDILMQHCGYRRNAWTIERVREWLAPTHEEAT